MSTPSTIARSISLFALCACGARVAVDDAASSSVCELPQLAPEGPFTAEMCLDRCTRGAVAEDGAPVRLACDGERCVLSVDGVERCTCTDLDYSNTCANGVAVCQHHANFNFAATTSVPCSVP
jgi:hypothetical protein